MSQGAGTALAPEMPSNIDAERSVLGAILLDEKTSAINAASEKIKSGDFFLKEHQIIFHVMLAQHDAGQAIDITTLIGRLTDERKLEMAGGAGYVAKLIDGVARVSNVCHYAQIVYEKSLLRKLIHSCSATQEKAFGALANYDDLYSELQASVKESTNGNGKKKLHLIDGQDLLTMNTSPLEWVIEPILPTQGLGMLYAWRGCGKTYLMLELCYAICVGEEKCFLWKIPRPRRVVYIDGELPANALQLRWQNILRGHGHHIPEKGSIGFVNRTVDKRAPNIATAEGQHLVEEHLQEGTFLVLDNISALCRTAKEDEEGWASTQEWLIDLRHKGITTWLLHHAGKGGTQRGTSKREDFLDAIIKMCHPADYSPDQLLRCEVHSEKYRGDDPRAVMPFEVRLETDQRGAAVFSHRPLQDVIEKRASEMFEMGMKVTEIAEELHISRFQVYRLKKRQPK